MCIELKTICYRDPTIHGIKVKCVQFDRFARQNGLPSTFLLDLVDRFLREQYHYPYPTGTKLPEQTQDIAAQMRKLTDIALHGTFYYAKQPIFPDYPATYRSICNAFLVHLDKGAWSSAWDDVRTLRFFKLFSKVASYVPLFFETGGIVNSSIFGLLTKSPVF